MSIITILLFFVYTYGIGYSATFFFKNSADFFERNIMRIGIGLGAAPFLLVLLNLLRVPIDWRIVLALSLVIPVYTLIKTAGRSIKNAKFSLKLSHIIILILFGLTLFMYLKGAFSYPYLEDDDPWAHATGIKYVSVEKNIADPNNNFMYITPYPPGFDALFGILHQTSPSLMWTMKFFNALIISLGILFFYFFAKSFMRSSKKAMYSTIVLAMVPCYLSHFIWAHSLVTTMFLVSLYCMVMIGREKMWAVPAALVIGGMAVTQPTQPIKYLVMFMIYVAVLSIYSKKIKWAEAGAVTGGYLISLIWWAGNWKAMFLRGARGKVTENVHVPILNKVIELIQKAFPNYSGTATRPYNFADFFIAKSQNMINNPVGVGITISLIALFSIFLFAATYKSMKKAKKEWVVIALLWLVFTFLGINSLTFNLPVGFFAFRFWMLFAIPLSIIAGEGIMFLAQFFRQFNVPKIATVIVLVFLIFLTSGKQKYDVNTANWPPGAMWSSYDEVSGYTWLKTLPIDTKVFAYSSDEQVIGFDMYSCLWCDDTVQFRKEILYKNATEVYNWVKSRNYQYFIIDGKSYRELAYTFGDNTTQELLPQRFDELSKFGGFQVVHQTQGMAVFRIL